MSMGSRAFASRAGHPSPVRPRRSVSVAQCHLSRDQPTGSRAGIHPGTADVVRTIGAARKDEAGRQMDGAEADLAISRLVQDRRGRGDRCVRGARYGVNAVTCDCREALSRGRSLSSFGRAACKEQRAKRTDEEDLHHDRLIHPTGSGNRTEATSPGSLSVRECHVMRR